MTRLAYLNEPGVLQNLKSRYAMNEIYVSWVVQHISTFLLFFLLMHTWIQSCEFLVIWLFSSYMLSRMIVELLVQITPPESCLYSVYVSLLFLFYLVLRCLLFLVSILEEFGILQHCICLYFIICSSVPNNLVVWFNRLKMSVLSRLILATF